MTVIASVLTVQGDLSEHATAIERATPSSSKGHPRRMYIFL